MVRPGGMPLWQWQSAGESRWARDGARQRGSATCGKQSDPLVTLLYQLFMARAICMHACGSVLVFRVVLLSGVVDWCEPRQLNGSGVGGLHG